MKSATTDRLWRAGVVLASLPVVTTAWAAEGGGRPGSSTMPAALGPAASGVEIAIVGDALVIGGTPEDDRILVKATRHPDTVRVIFNGLRLGHYGPVARIEVDAGDGDDVVLVSGAVELPVRLNGGPGDDRLRGGAGPDLVFGEDGNDVLVATHGRDALDGGPGSNRLVVRRPMGAIHVGPSAAGDAMRILSKAYDLPPLDTGRDGAGPSTIETGPRVVGPAELLDDATVDGLTASYEAGHTIALSGAAATEAELLRRLLGHTSGGSWDPAIPQADLVAFRRAIRPDGGLHEITSILLPREAVELPPAAARRGAREADMLAVEWLSGVFSARPVLTDSQGACTGLPPQECLQTLATSYQSKILKQTSAGLQVQTDNSVWNARSFQNQEDFYYVLQEIDYHARVIATSPSWFTITSNIPGASSTTLTQPTPSTTLETEVVTSGVSLSLGGNIGFNETEGLNATTSAGVTIQNSTTRTVPPVVIRNTSDFSVGAAQWEKSIDLRGQGGAVTVTLFNQWIWQIPFASYGSGQRDIDFQSSAQLILGDAPGFSVQALFSPTVPLPFGDVFALEVPMVTSIDPTSVSRGQTFTTTGAGFYPSLITGVTIGGEPLDTGQFSTVSDTEITVVAPNTPGSSLPVVVQTTEGVSNDNVTIEIIDDLASTAGRMVPAVARTAAVPSPDG